MSFCFYLSMAYNASPKSLMPEPIIGILSDNYFITSAIYEFMPFLSFLIISELETKLAAIQLAFKVFTKQ
jgi:hypothetical protein